MYPCTFLLKQKVEVKIVYNKPELSLKEISYNILNRPQNSNLVHLI